MKKVQLKFNPDTMTVSDLKRCAETLRTLLRTQRRYEKFFITDGDDMRGFEREMCARVAELRVAFEVVE